MNRRVDLSVLPSDLAALYAEPELDHGVIKLEGIEQLELPVEPAATTFRRWLEAQPQPAYIGGQR